MVQLKARMTIDKKYVDKNLYICFPDGDVWYLVLHDKLLHIVGEVSGAFETSDWCDKGIYSWPNGPSQKVRDALLPCALKLNANSMCESLQ